MIMPRSSHSDNSQSWQYWKRNMVPVIESPFTNVAEAYGFKGNSTPAVHSTNGGCKLGTAMYD